VDAVKSNRTLVSPKPDTKFTCEQGKIKEFCWFGIRYLLLAIGKIVAFDHRVGRKKMDTVCLALQEIPFFPFPISRLPSYIFYFFIDFLHQKNINCNNL